MIGRVLKTALCLLGCLSVAASAQPGGFWGKVMNAAVQGTGSGCVSPSYGPELVVNGSFATNSDWSGTNWAIAAGVATATSSVNLFTNNSAADLSASFTYHTVYTISGFVSGTLTINVGNSGTQRNANGTYAEDILGDVAKPRFVTDAGGSTLSIDNVSVKKVLC